MNKPETTSNNKLKYRGLIILISVLIPAVVVVLLFVRIESIPPLTFLPPIYASINGLTALLLILAYRSILKKNGHDHLIGNKKLGFNVNTINLWKKNGHKLCKEFLTNSRVVEDRWINDDWIQKYIDSSELDIKYVNKFFGILAFEIWYRIFVTKEMNSNTTLD